MPATMLTACMLGMFAGLEVDDCNGRLATLGALCTSGALSLVDLARLHWHQLPAMHLGMIIGAFVGVPHRYETQRPLYPARLVRAIVCYSSMLIGMEAGMLIALNTFSGSQTTAVMLIGMTSGMILGLICGEAIVGCLDRSDRGRERRWIRRQIPR